MRPVRVPRCTAVGLAALAAAAALAPGCSSSGAGETAATGSDTAAPNAVPAGTVPPGTIVGATPCPRADGSSERVLVFSQPPPTCIDPAKTYTVTMETSKGEVELVLDAKRAPVAVNNFVVLARYHFYDTLPFTRNILGYVIGAGVLPPPLADNPGYRFDDELPATSTAYEPGALLMDNDGPNTNGSKFMIMVDNHGIAPKFTIFGKVTAGLDTTVKAIAATGSPSGKPSADTTITSVTITES